ncbi:hypothetical protein [Paenibacillus sedimenti]|uniref:Uncharacterized protein n=1 Tax=Paenibacillus sedimenti TaxID=2770274 RepID=A0A926KRM6_9BACL|nr:hypothetical protein [Paenibacillus sedimenti]MBD0382053.1 hypothetical protein [Paenibacillus sedimenti]
MSKEMNTGQERNVEKENCCGGPAPTETDACCASDAAAKVVGQDGCGCDSNSTDAKSASGACCSVNL